MHKSDPREKEILQLLGLPDNLVLNSYTGMDSPCWFVCQVNCCLSSPTESFVVLGPIILITVIFSCITVGVNYSLVFHLSLYGLDLH